MCCGVSIKPNTPVETLFDLLDESQRRQDQDGEEGIPLVDLVFVSFHFHVPISSFSFSHPFLFFKRL